MNHLFPWYIDGPSYSTFRKYRLWLKILLLNGINLAVYALIICLVIKVVFFG